MKKLTALLLVFVLVFSLYGCGKDGKASDSFEYNYDYDLSEYITLPDVTTLQRDPVSFVIRSGDSVDIDFEGYMDGELVDQCTGSQQGLVIGSGTFIPGFEEGLIGYTVGDEVTLDIAFPEDYKVNPDFAGLPVTFVVNVKAINGNVTEEEYEGSILWGKFYEACEVKDYPELELSQMITQQTEYYESYAEAYGLSLDDMIDQMGMTKEAFEAQIESYCQGMISQDMALYALCRQEGIEASDEALESSRQLLLESYGVESEKDFEDAYGIKFDDPAVQNSIELTALLEGAMDYLRNNVPAAAPAGISGEAADASAEADQQ